MHLLCPNSSFWPIFRALKRIVWKATRTIGTYVLTNLGTTCISQSFPC